MRDPCRSCKEKIYKSNNTKMNFRVVCVSCKKNQVRQKKNIKHKIINVRNAGDNTDEEICRLGWILVVVLGLWVILLTIKED